MVSIRVTKKVPTRVPTRVTRPQGLGCIGFKLYKVHGLKFSGSGLRISGSGFRVSTHFIINLTRGFMTKGL